MQDKISEQNKKRKTFSVQTAKKLISWYEGNKRDLPWRRTKDPYRIWISEIMLQQTRVEAVVGYYDRFLKALPDLRSLAACPEKRLLKLWEGLGYYNRARNLQKAAKILTAEGKTQLPDRYEALLKLPGIGAYTAGAVSSIAFSLPYPAVDGNVLRVFARWRKEESAIDSAGLKNGIGAELRDLFLRHPELEPGSMNQALMELGATVCLPNGEPLCTVCPLKTTCLAHRDGCETAYPVVGKKQERRIEERTVFLIRSGEKTGIRKRASSGLLAGLYEFPNIKGYITSKEAVKRLRAYGLEVLRIRELPEAKHIFSHLEWHMKGYEIDVASPAKRGRFLFVEDAGIRKNYAIPEAFSVYKQYLR